MTSLGISVCPNTDGKAKKDTLIPTPYNVLCFCFVLVVSQVKIIPALHTQ